MGLTMKIEEIPTVGMITKDAFHNDKTDFTNFSPDYADPFEEDFVAKLTAVDNVVTTRFHIGQIKQMTDTLKAEIKLFYPMLDYLGKYAKKAKANLLCPLGSFGIKEMRKGIHDVDIEALLGAAETLKLNVEANMTALAAKGYKDEDYTNFKDLRDKVFGDNKQQEEWKYDKEQAVEENMILFLEVESIIKDIQETGRILYKRTSPAKAKEYTMTNVLSKIRHTGGEPEVEAGELCTVTVDCFSATDQKPIKDLSVTILEYSMTLKTDIAGRALFDYVPLMPWNTVTVKITGTGWKEKTETEQTLIGGEVVDIDVNMVAE